MKESDIKLFFEKAELLEVASVTISDIYFYEAARFLLFEPYYNTIDYLLVRKFTAALSIANGDLYFSIYNLHTFETLQKKKLCDLSILNDVHSYCLIDGPSIILAYSTMFTIYSLKSGLLLTQAMHAPCFYGYAPLKVQNILNQNDISIVYMKPIHSNAFNDYNNHSKVGVINCRSLYFQPSMSPPSHHHSHMCASGESMQDIISHNDFSDSCLMFQYNPLDPLTSSVLTITCMTLHQSTPHATPTTPTTTPLQLILFYTDTSNILYRNILPSFDHGTSSTPPSSFPNYLWETLHNPNILTFPPPPLDVLSLPFEGSAYQVSDIRVLNFCGISEPHLILVFMKPSLHNTRGSKGSKGTSGGGGLAIISGPLLVPLQVIDGIGGVFLPPSMPPSGIHHELMCVSPQVKYNQKLQLLLQHKGVLLLADDASCESSSPPCPMQHYHLSCSLSASGVTTIVALAEWRPTITQRDIRIQSNEWQRTVTCTHISMTEVFSQDPHAQDLDSEAPAGMEVDDVSHSNPASPGLTTSPNKRALSPPPCEGGGLHEVVPTNTSSTLEGIKSDSLEKTHKKSKKSSSHHKHRHGKGSRRDHGRSERTDDKGANTTQQVVHQKVISALLTRRDKEFVVILDSHRSLVYHQSLLSGLRRKLVGEVEHIGDSSKGETIVGRVGDDERRFKYLLMQHHTHQVFSGAEDSINEYAPAPRSVANLAARHSASVSHAASPLALVHAMCTMLPVGSAFDGGQRSSTTYQILAIACVWNNHPSDSIRDIVLTCQPIDKWSQHFIQRVESSKIPALGGLECAFLSCKIWISSSSSSSSTGRISSGDHHVLSLCCHFISSDCSFVNKDNISYDAKLSQQSSPLVHSSNSVLCLLSHYTFKIDVASCHGDVKNQRVVTSGFNAKIPVIVARIFTPQANLDSRGTDLEKGVFYMMQSMNESLQQFVIESITMVKSLRELRAADKTKDVYVYSSRATRHVLQWNVIMRHLRLSASHPPFPYVRVFSMMLEIVEVLYPTIWLEQRNSDLSSLPSGVRNHDQLSTGLTCDICVPVVRDCVMKVIQEMTILSSLYQEQAVVNIPLLFAHSNSSNASSAGIGPFHRGKFVQIGPRLRDFGCGGVVDSLCKLLKSQLTTDAAMSVLLTNTVENGDEPCIYNTNLAT